MSMVVSQLSAASAYSGVVAELRAAFLRGVSRPLAWRRDQLGGLEALIQENSAELYDALQKDLGKCSSESWITDIGLALSPIDTKEVGLLDGSRAGSESHCFGASPIVRHTRTAGRRAHHFAMELSRSAHADAPHGGHCRRQLRGCQTF